LTASLEQYLALLVKWNEKINLVGTRDVDEIRERHIADALAVVPHIPPDARRLIDVGSGAGLPGAIIAIARPELAVVALEPIHKKHAFLAALRRELPLPNFDPRAIRVEDLPANERDFDVAVSRATFALDEWLARGRELVRPGGLVLGMEGADEVELPAGATRHRYQLGNRSRAIITLPT
jgi:16S rRNA (guanine527-N7)-methyltransferase